jgi:hypothetical protein
LNAKPLQALGDELQPAFIAGQLVHPGHGADFVKIGGAFGLFRAVGFDQDQADDPLIAVGSRLDGRQPGFFVEQQRQRLRREERPFGQRQQIKRVGQNIGGGDDGVGDNTNIWPPGRSTRALSARTRSGHGATAKIRCNTTASKAAAG